VPPSCRHSPRPKLELAERGTREFTDVGHSPAPASNAGSQDDVLRPLNGEKASYERRSAGLKSPTCPSSRDGSGATYPFVSIFEPEQSGGCADRFIRVKVAEKDGRRQSRTVNSFVRGELSSVASGLQQLNH
jgi:hypothetical protein